ncbi:hypothetical protein BB561_006633 [Smittium simulii]|uniref:Uncharacterized protein n=1 Tax=Smittium simulii TaxID=133385 RepID=A0A2T9Y2P9_9FUNG|nr:hypothetical protein BB561_006633 [Smittium simulii]
MPNSSSVPSSLSITPTALLAISDHIYRTHHSHGNFNKVIGLLFGSYNKPTIEVHLAAEIIFNENSNKDSNVLSSSFLNSIVEQISFNVFPITSTLQLDLVLNPSHSILGWYASSQKNESDKFAADIYKQISQFNKNLIFLNASVSESVLSLLDKQNSQKHISEISSNFLRAHHVSSSSKSNIDKNITFQNIDIVYNISATDMVVLNQLESIHAAGSNSADHSSPILNSIETKLEAIKSLKDNLDVLLEFVNLQIKSNKKNMDEIDDTIIQKINQICVNMPNLSHTNSKPSTDKQVDAKVFDILSTMTDEIVNLSSWPKTKY